MLGEGKKETSWLHRFHMRHELHLQSVLLTIITVVVGVTLNRIFDNGDKANSALNKANANEIAIAGLQTRYDAKYTASDIYRRINAADKRINSIDMNVADIKRQIKRIDAAEVRPAH